jgi:L-serine/L-threonine ammonia-lyase
MIAKIRAAGATDVIQHGATWKEADGYLREQILKNDPNGVYVPPFDHADIWAGNSTIVEEVARQIPDGRPDAIVCSVGGGGLFNGVMLGLEKQRWTGMNVLAVETKGADSLATSLQEGQLATLDEITSVATSLAAKQTSHKTYELAQREGVKSVVLSDAEAAMGCWRLADDERLMVELACGVSVAVCYDGRLKKLLPGLTKESKVVIVLCGGSNVSLEMLVEYRHKYGSVEKVATKSKSVPSTLTAPPAGHVKGAEVVNMDEMMRTCEGAAGEHLPDMATIMQVAREFDS